MLKFFLGAAFSAAFIAGNMDPVLADTTTSNTDGEVTAHSVEVNPDLAEIEGRTLTDAEAVRVEGQVLRIEIPRPIGICMIGVPSPCNSPNYWNRPGWGWNNPKLINPWMPIIRIR